MSTRDVSTRVLARLVRKRGETKQFSVRLPADLVARINVLATDMQISRTAVVTALVQRGLER